MAAHRVAFFKCQVSVLATTAFAIEGGHRTDGEAATAAKQLATLIRVSRHSSVTTGTTADGIEDNTLFTLASSVAMIAR
jgi:hypothetical protein